MIWVMLVFSLSLAPIVRRFLEPVSYSFARKRLVIVPRNHVQVNVEDLPSRYTAVTPANDNARPNRYLVRRFQEQAVFVLKYHHLPLALVQVAEPACHIRRPRTVTKAWYRITSSGFSGAPPAPQTPLLRNNQGLNPLNVGPNSPGRVP